MTKTDGESYYSKVKQENEELRQKVAWLENDSFLLDSEVDKRQVYYYLKKNPGSAKFIYRKYRGLQPIIRELCDKENPLYLAIIGLPFCLGHDNSNLHNYIGLFTFNTISICF